MLFEKGIVRGGLGAVGLKVILKGVRKGKGGDIGRDGECDIG
ncbi:hypothetical protein [Siminovitchia fortis]|nr:hypothetical protein [Siminovitchia fortis]